MGNRTYVKVLTDRDRELLAWTGRCGLASAVQLARRFWLGAREQTARNRLQQLARSGYLVAAHYRHGRASLLVYSLTKKGRDLFSPSQRERLFVGLPDAGALREQLLAQEVRLRLELDARARGDQVLDWQTERELRAEASREQRQDPRSRDTRAASVEIADARMVIQRADGGIAPNGDVTSITQQASSPDNQVYTNTFTYDALDRLATASSTSALFPSESTNFDSLGRMTTRTIGGTPYAYTYGDAAHVDAPTAYHGRSYSYDALGQQTTGTVGGRNETRTFDAEHRLGEVVSTGVATSTVNFLYDGTGKRLIQTVTSGGVSTATLYIGNLYEEQLGKASKAAYTSYYYLGGRLVGLRRANWSTGASNGQERLVGDHLGSTTLLVDTTANPGPQVQQRAYYTPYGEMAYEYTPVDSLTSRNFTGQRLDSDTGLLYYGARYYDSGLAYFISADPTDPKLAKALSSDWNRYIYVRDNPLRHIDPSGYSAQDYYVFVNGCVSGGCGGPPDWNEYMDYLHNLFVQGDWGK